MEIRKPDFSTLLLAFWLFMGFFVLVGEKGFLVKAWGEENGRRERGGKGERGDEGGEADEEGLFYY